MQSVCISFTPPYGGNARTATDLAFRGTQQSPSQLEISALLHFGLRSISGRYSSTILARPTTLTGAILARSNALGLALLASSK